MRPCDLIAGQPFRAAGSRRAEAVKAAGVLGPIRVAEVDGAVGQVQAVQRGPFVAIEAGARLHHERNIGRTGDIEPEGIGFDDKSTVGGLGHGVPQPGEPFEEVGPTGGAGEVVHHGLGDAHERIGGEGRGVTLEKETGQVEVAIEAAAFQVGDAGGNSKIRQAFATGEGEVGEIGEVGRENDARQAATTDEGAPAEVGYGVGHEHPGETAAARARVAFDGSHAVRDGEVADVGPGTLEEHRGGAVIKHPTDALVNRVLGGDVDGEQARAAGEGTRPDVGEGGRDRDIGQDATVSAGVFANIGCAHGNHEDHQARATVKGVVADTGQTEGQINLLKAAATEEQSVGEAGDAAGDRHAYQAIAAAEGAGCDVDYRIGERDGCELSAIAEGAAPDIGGAHRDRIRAGPATGELHQGSGGLGEERPFDAPEAGVKRGDANIGETLTAGEDAIAQRDQAGGQSHGRELGAAVESFVAQEDEALGQGEVSQAAAAFKSPGLDIGAGAGHRDAGQPATIPEGAKLDACEVGRELHAGERLAIVKGPSLDKREGVGQGDGREPVAISKGEAAQIGQTAGEHHIGQAQAVTKGRARDRPGTGGHHALSGLADWAQGRLRAGLGVKDAVETGEVGVERGDGDVGERGASKKGTRAKQAQINGKG